MIGGERPAPLGVFSLANRPKQVGPLPESLCEGGRRAA